MLNANLGDPLIYWILRTIVLLSLLRAGWVITKSAPRCDNFWKASLPSIFIYSIVQGLRWMRGADYWHYYLDATGRWSSGGTPNPEPLYKFLVDFLGVILGTPYWMMFIIYSLLLIVPVFLIVRKIPQSAVWTLPLFYIITVTSSENLIRQFIAVSFILYAYYAYLKDDLKGMYISLTCAPLIHFSAIIPVFVFLLLKYKTLEIKRPWILVGIYLVLYFFWNPDYFQPFADYVQGLSIDNSNYLTDTDRWLTSDGALERKSLSLIYRCFEVFSFVILIYYGYKACESNKKFLLCFWLSYIGVLLHTIAGDIELYIRINRWFYVMYPFLYGIIMYNYSMKKKERIIITTILLLNFYFLGFIWQMSSGSYSGYAFIWDR